MQYIQNGQNDHKSLYSFLIYCSFCLRQCSKHLAGLNFFLSFSSLNCIQFPLAARINSQTLHNINKTGSVWNIKQQPRYHVATGGQNSYVVFNDLIDWWKQPLQPQRQDGECYPWLKNVVTPIIGLSMHLASKRG